MRGLVLACACAFLVAGCHLVFPVDGNGDGAPQPPCEAIGHNEDGDSHDDACDPCPHVSSYDDADADKDDDLDGVGNGCDPEPGAPNKRLWFDGFGAPAPSEYAYYGGGVVGDAFQFESGTIGTLTWGTDVPRVVVRTEVEIFATGAAGLYREVGVLVDARPPSDGSQPTGNYCVVGRDPTEVDYQQMYYRQRPAGDDPIMTAEGNSIVVEDVRAIEARYAPEATPTLTCMFVAFDGSTNLISGNAINPGGGIGIYAMRVGASYTYLWVVALAESD